MEIAEGKSNLSGVKLDSFLAEPSLLREMFEKLATLDELHDKIDS